MASTPDPSAFAPADSDAGLPRPAPPWHPWAAPALVPEQAPAVLVWAEAGDELPERCAAWTAGAPVARVRGADELLERLQARPVAVALVPLPAADESFCRQWSQDHPATALVLLADEASAVPEGLGRVACGADDCIARHDEARLQAAVVRGLRQHGVRGAAADTARMAASEQRFRLLADAMPHIVWTSRAEGGCTYLNERWFEYTGMPRPAPGTVLLSWAEYLHPDDHEATFRRWRECLAAGTLFDLEYRLRGADGQYRWFMGRAVPHRDATGRIVQWYGTCTEIEDQKRLAQEREALLAAERAARSEAERAARMKDEFVATLSHELRTPLSAIVGWAAVLRRGVKSPEQMRQAIDTIDRNARLQAQMIDELLDMSRILSGKLRLDVQPLDMVRVIEDAIDTVRPALEAKALRLSTVFGSAGVIQGDPARLQQVVWNLLTNAIKFTPKGGRITVTYRKVGSHVELAVSDTGQGIPPEFLPHVFDRFRQFDASTTRSKGGLGLGLAIVRHLTEMHGGHVHAYSEGEGRGATFTITLPLTAIHPAETHVSGFGALMPACGEGDLLKGLTVLVVDDEPDARELLRRVLEDEGAAVREAAGCAEALAVLDEEPAVHLIVSDIGMPGEDGYSFMRKVRSSGRPYATVPAAALTALARSEDRRRALMAGFQTHVAKPVDPSELVAVVASLTGRTGLGD